jgi:signal transduction histidine kinase
VAAFRSEVRPDLGIYVIAGSRVVTAEAGEAPVAVGSIPLARDLKAGESIGGDLTATDGSLVLYSATIVRREGAVVGPLALVLTTPDRSGALALRDLLRVLPAVGVVVALIAFPIAWLLSRSITRPLRRLADATSGVPAPGTPTPTIVPEGPREIRELTRRFNAMTGELDRIRIEERELLANVRHDLKTPLTVVSGFAEALRDGTAKGSGVTRAGDAIAQEADRMGRLVEDLRSIDDLGSGGVAMRPEAVDAAVLVREAAARFSPRAAAAGLELRADADAALTLVADRAAVERILGNLIDNALGVARPSGHILVEARGATGAAAQGLVVFRVSDDGPGFPPGTLERAFDRFYRADPARTGPGTGLGLSIVRALARAHGGEAVAENLAPSGARITVTLPGVPPAG